jgi:hypothetical protein
LFARRGIGLIMAGQKSLTGGPAGPVEPVGAG